jgi:hypothetical protein
MPRFEPTTEGSVGSFHPPYHVIANVRQADGSKGWKSQ